MKALSVRQPWAWLIGKGWKDVENRSWATSYRGRLYIHASKSKDDMHGLVLADIEQKMVRHQLTINDVIGFASNFYDNMDFGAIIGEVDIIECLFRHPESKNSIYSVWHEPGKYGFYLANAVLYQVPIPCKGSQGLFNPGPDFKEWLIMKPLIKTEGE